MYSRHRRLALALCAFVFIAGCGDDGSSSPAGSAGGEGATVNDDAATDDDAATNDDAADSGNGTVNLSAWPPENEDLSGAGGAGTVTVDGTSYDIDVTVECDVTDFAAGDGRERIWEIQGAGVEDPEDRFSEMWVVKVWTGTTTRDREEQAIGWDGPEGLFDGSASGSGDVWTEASNNLDGPPLEVTSDRVTGELLLRSALGNEPVVATVDLELPDTTDMACHS